MKNKNNISLYFLKKLYSFLIHSVIIIDKPRSEEVIYNENIKEFSRLNIHTTSGTFVFKFKKDQRVPRLPKERFYITTFLIEVEIPPNANDIIKELEHKLLLVVKLIVLKPNYQILSEVLMSVYLDKFIHHFKSKK